MEGGITVGEAAKRIADAETKSPGSAAIDGISVIAEA